MINNNLRNIKKILLSDDNNNQKNLKQNSTILNKDQFLEYIQTDFSEAFELYRKGTVIYRGIDASEHFIMQKPVYRTSAYTNNYYTMLFSEILPSWSKYPKRNHSIICTTNHKKTEAYGERYIIFPKNGTKLGICPQNDIWDSFSNQFRSLDHLNDSFLILKKMLDNSTIVSDKHLLKMLDEFQKLSNKKIEEFKNLANNGEIRGFGISFSGLEIFKNFLDHKDNLIEYLDNILSPKKNNFQLGYIKDIINKKTNEIWFDNICLMMKEEYYEDK
jgi:hypothetical protein